ncbi:hypothetical protein NEIG_01390 [Nematocida sp. ERTm5]|nr:hypothetical protein NEIRO02_0559 [Nematocida sp. AWRm79]KAI5182941.1 hypothetical protein NEIRO03_0576 [Nematocida sp. AWRm78]OAG32467.1 hypothetical protein NEIG_01390 [Nematocida sp. ERTm5]
MPSIRKIKQRIQAYKSTVALLNHKIKKLETKVGDMTEILQESIEEGEIRNKTKEKRKRKLDECNNEVKLLDIEEKAKTNMVEALKEIFDTFNIMEQPEIRRIFLKILPYLDNSLKYLILHDIVLFSRDLDKYSTVYSILYSDAIEKDGSEISDVLETIYYYSIAEEAIDGLKSRCISILEKYATRTVFVEERIVPEVFDAVTSIRLYSKVLDWCWTYNEFIRDILYPELKKSESAFAVLVLSAIYAEWNKSLSPHKSLEYVIQILDKVAGVGTGEEITPSMHSLEAQLASALMLRQFRPGASVKWHRKRIDEASDEQKALIESVWKISFF